jgi:hypothetical protein
MESKGLTFDNLINELKNNNAQTVKGSYTFKELTHKQQRKILSGNFDAVEIPAKLSNIYSDYLNESVYKNDDTVELSRIITLETKPYFINVLRTISFGKTYYSKGEAYNLYEVQAEDLEPKAQPHVVVANKFKIHLAVPTISEDERYNNLLTNALGPYKKRKSIKDVNVGSVTDLYQIYELLKYIVSFEFNGEEYRFNQYSIQDRIKFLNNLSSITIEEIKEYVKNTVKKAEETALTAISPTTGNKIIADINTIFFSTTMRKDDSEEEDDDDDED